jgi:hypothetical protein
MAARSEPAPASLVFVTVKVAADAAPAGRRSVAASAANVVVRLFMTVGSLDL